MTPKRDYIAEILSKKGRLHRRGTPMDSFTRRVEPLVKGFRVIKGSRNASFREEWLKYGAIGYVACIEGYLRLWIARLINHGTPFIERVAALDSLKFSPEAVVGIHVGRVSIGDFVAHLLPLNGIADINAQFSVLMGQDFIGLIKKSPPSSRNPTPVGQLWPKMIGEVDALFKLRHVYAHELATRESVPAGKIEHYISSSASFVFTVEGLFTQAITRPRPKRS